MKTLIIIIGILSVGCDGLMTSATEVVTEVDHQVHRLNDVLKCAEQKITKKGECNEESSSRSN